MPAWPSTLPSAPAAGNFRETAPDTALRTKMEAGPAKVRRRTTAGVRLFALAYLLTGEQAAALDAFHEETLLGGTLAFDFSHPRDGSALSCRFSAPPVFAPEGGMIRASLELEALP